MLENALTPHQRQPIENRIQCFYYTNLVAIGHVPINELHPF